MTAPLIGWASPNFAGLPKDLPYLATNEGLVLGFFSDDYIYVGVDGATPAGAVYTIKFTPSLGGPPTETVLPDEGGGALGVQVSVFVPGVTTITAVVDGVPAENELVATTTSTGGAYGTLSWYGQAITPPLPSGQWRARA